MPKALLVDWSLAQAMFQEGLACTAISSRTGIPYHAVQKRSKRYNWRRLVLEPSGQPKQWIAPRSLIPIPSRAAQWQTKVLDIVDTHLATISDRSSPDVSLDDLEKLVRLTDATDRTARRTFGLDQGTTTTNVLVNVQSDIGQPRPSGQLNDVIDVESTSAGESVRKVS